MAERKRPSQLLRIFDLFGDLESINGTDQASSLLIQTVLFPVYHRTDQNKTTIPNFQIPKVVNKVPVWIDCDPGDDDAFALVLGSQHPSINLLGISACHGNATLVRTTENALNVSTAFERTDLPVYVDAPKPYCREHPEWASDVHGKTGIDGAEDLPKPGFSPRTDKHAVIAMRDALMAQPKGTAWLVLLGSFTNVALLMAMYPKIADHIKGLTIMGGSIGNGHTNAPRGDRAGEKDRVGNSTPWAEFNAFCDLESTKAIFTNAKLTAKTTIIPLDISHLVLITDTVLDLMLYGPLGEKVEKPSKARTIFSDLMKIFRGQYRDIYHLDGPLHDPIAMAVILDEEKVEKVGFDYNGGETFEIEVITEGDQTGRTIAKKLPSGSPGVRIPRGLDVPEFWRILERALSFGDK